MGKNKTLEDMTFLVALSSIICTIFNVFYLNESGKLAIFPNMLMVYAPLMGLLNSLFIRKDRTNKSIIIFNFSFIFLGELFVYFTSPVKAISFLLTAFFLIGFFSFFSFKMVANSKTRSKSFIRMFDVSMGVFLLSLVAIFFWEYPLSFCYSSFIGLVVSLLSVIIKKQSKSHKKNGFIFVYTAVVIALIFFLYQYGSRMGEGIVSIWQYLVLLFDKFAAFIDWLFSIFPTLFPNPSGKIIPNVTDDPYKKDPLVVTVLSENVFQIIFFSILFVAALIMLFLFFKHLNLNKRVKGEEHRKTTISRPSLLRSIKKDLMALVAKIQLFIFIQRNKNSDIGLYLWLKSSLKRDIWRKKDDETPREFVSRLDSYLNSSLMDYIDNIEIILYSGRDKVKKDVPNSAEIRKRVRKEVRRRRLKSISRKMRFGLKKSSSAV